MGHDWGALVAWTLCAFRPDKVKALVNLSVPYMPRNPAVRPVDSFRATYGNDLYISRFQVSSLSLLLYGLEFCKLLLFVPFYIYTDK